MANKIVATVAGGSPQTLDGVNTVADVKAKLNLDGNYTATVNGDPADSDQELEDYQQVHFAPSTKGGC